jgi:hypothetical protein
MSRLEYWIKAFFFFFFFTTTTTTINGQQEIFG